MTNGQRLPISVVFWLFPLLALALYFAQTPFIMALISVAVGTLISPLLDVFENKTAWPRALLAAFVYLALIALVGGIGYFLQKMASDQAAALANQLPNLYEDIRKNIQPYMERNDLNEFLRHFQVRRFVDNMGKRVMNIVGTTAAWLSWSIFVLVVSFYLSIHLRYYHKLAIALSPKAHKDKTERALRASAKTLRQWFGAQLMDMAIVGLLTSIGLYLVGFKYWLVLGALTFALTIIPFIGIFTVIALSVLVALANDPSQLPWVLLVFFATQQLEGNLILPYLMRERVLLPEVFLLIFMVFMASWLGLMGILISAPLLAVVFALYKEFSNVELEKPPGITKGRIKGPKEPS